MRKLIYHSLLGAALLFGLAWAVPAGADGYEHDDIDDRIPRLVGYGCKGSSGPLFANEEDHFPKCKNIEAWR